MELEPAFSTTIVRRTNNFIPGSWKIAFESFGIANEPVTLGIVFVQQSISRYVYFRRASHFRSSGMTFFIYVLLLRRGGGSAWNPRSWDRKNAHLGDQ